MKITNVLKLLLMLLLFGYLIFAFVRVIKGGDEPVCNNVIIKVEDSDKASFVKVSELEHILANKGLDPKGKRKDKIVIYDIKKAIDGHQFVLNSLCYVMPNGDVHIEVTQRLPLLRVKANNGEDYYIDASGEKIPDSQYPANVVVVTGNVDYRQAKTPLSTIGQIIRSDEFWDDMIEQINVTDKGKYQLVPRIGNHIVELGMPEDLDVKLAHLKTFYSKVMVQVGWQKYKRLNLEYKNKIICEKTT